MGGARGKEHSCQCRRHKRFGLDPWVGNIPWRREEHLTSVFLPGESHGQRRLAGCSPRGHKKSGTTEQLSRHAERGWAALTGLHPTSELRGPPDRLPISRGSTTHPGQLLKLGNARHPASQALAQPITTPAIPTYPKHPESVRRLFSSRPPASLQSLRRSPHQAPGLHPLPEQAWDADRASLEAFPGLHDRWTPNPFLQPPSELSQIHPCPGSSPPPLPCSPALPSLLPRSPLSFPDPDLSFHLRALHMLFPLPVTPFPASLPPSSHSANPLILAKVSAPSRGADSCPHRAPTPLVPSHCSHAFSSFLKG